MGAGRPWPAAFTLLELSARSDLNSSWSLASWSRRSTLTAWSLAISSRFLARSSIPLAFSASRVVLFVWAFSTAARYEVSWNWTAVSCSLLVDCRRSAAMIRFSTSRRSRGLVGLLDPGRLGQVENRPGGDVGFLVGLFERLLLLRDPLFPVHVELGDGREHDDPADHHEEDQHGQDFSRGGHRTSPCSHGQRTTEPWRRGAFPSI